MKSVRLLPVVILAALALLIFKGVGLVTTGGYILTGAGQVQAAGAAPAPAGAEGEPTMALPDEPTMDDTSPTLSDAVPTVGTPEPEDHGAEPAAHDAETEAAEGHDTADAAHDDAPTVPDLGAADDPRSEAVPMMQNAAGELVPLAGETGSVTEDIVLERLSARRAELDAREEELNLRLQLIEAAESQLEARAAALAELEAQISALVDQREAGEDEQFVAIVKMYEQMKPADAAAIFNELDLEVLLKVARGMNPRKMSPIMAKMTTARAQALTLALAAVEPQPAAVTPRVEDLASLPQIVGE